MAPPPDSLNHDFMTISTGCQAIMLGAKHFLISQKIVNHQIVNLRYSTIMDFDNLYGN